MTGAVVFGILIGIVIFATMIVVWQVVLTLTEVRDTLRTVRELTSHVEDELVPILNEVNGLLQKSNQSLEHMEAVGEKLESIYGALQRFAVATKKQTFRMWRQYSRRFSHREDDLQVIKGEVVSSAAPTPDPAEQPTAPVSPAP